MIGNNSKTLCFFKTKVLSFLLQIIKIIIGKIIPNIAFLAFSIIPFMHKVLSLKMAYIIWIPSVTIFIISSVLFYIKNKNKSDELQPADVLTRGMHIVALCFFVSAFIANYYDIGYSWWWVIAITTAIAVPITLCNMWKYVVMKNEYTEEKTKHTKVNLIKYILFYWLADGFYISVFSHSLIGQFITGGLCIVIIFTNLSSLVVSRKVVSKVAMLHDFIAGIAITVYLIYIIPDVFLQNIVLVISGSLFGGLITLVGVAWTIKDGQRRELESKRLEKIPYIEVDFGDWIVKEKHGVEFPSLWLDINRSGNEFYSTMGKSLEICNIGLGMATDLKCKWLSGGIIEDKTLPITLLKCESSNKFNIMVMAKLPEKESYCTNSSIIFEYKDLLGNQYNQELNITFEVHRNYTTIIDYKINAPQYISINN